MTRLEGDSPIDLFDQKTAKSIDFQGFLRLLAQEGIEAMTELSNQRETEELRERSLGTMITYTAYRILHNRQEQ